MNMSIPFYLSSHFRLYSIVCINAHFFPLIFNVPNEIEKEEEKRNLMAFVWYVTNHIQLNRRSIRYCFVWVCICLIGILETTSNFREYKNLAQQIICCIFFLYFSIAKAFSGEFFCFFSALHAQIISTLINNSKFQTKLKLNAEFSFFCSQKTHSTHSCEHAGFSVLRLQKGVKINNGPFASKHSHTHKKKFQTFRVHTFTVICLCSFISYFSGDYYIGPRRSDRAIPWLDSLSLYLFVYCSFFIYLVFRVFVGVCVCVLQSKRMIYFTLHQKPNGKLHNPLSPQTPRFVTALLAGSPQRLSFIITCIGHVMTIYMFEYVITTQTCM